MLGSLFFLFSLVSPFCLSSGSFMGVGEVDYYWSYKYDVHVYLQRSFPVGFRQSRFSDYWFNSLFQKYFGITWILISMFIIQVLTLICSTISMIVNRRLLSLAPVYLSLTILVLMIYTGNKLFEGYYYEAFQQGYYLVYPSVFLFATAFTLNISHSEAT